MLFDEELGWKTKARSGEKAASSGNWHLKRKESGMVGLFEVSTAWSGCGKRFVDSATQHCIGSSAA